MTDNDRVEDLLRNLAPQVLSALTRRYHQFDLCEDATQDALLAASRSWPIDGVPANPRAWLVTVGSRRVIDHIRADSSRRAREERVAHGSPAAELLDATHSDHDPTRDDSLVLLVLCCHPALTVPSQIALTLRAVGGLTTAEIAAGFVVPEATMAQRIARAKQTIRSEGATFDLPDVERLTERLDAVMHVLYLIFNEGHTATGGEQLARVDLTNEAIRLCRHLHRLRPDDTEAAGLLALMLLTDARRHARTTPDGELVPLDRQDRQRWDQDMITEGTALVTDALAHGLLGAYQLQAAINAVHDAATSTQTTDWTEIVALYSLLETVAPNPMITLSKAVAVAMQVGPQHGLAMLDTLLADERLRRHHRTHAVRGHLLEMSGRHLEARASFETASRLATNIAEKRHLQTRAAAATTEPA